MNNTDYIENLKRKHVRRPHKYTAENGFKPYQVEVRDDPMRAFRTLERMLKKDRVFETYKEKQYYTSPSQRRNQANKRKKRRIAEENRRREEERRQDK